MYENYLCIIERNNYGHTVIAFAKSAGAVNLYRKQEADTITGNMAEKLDWDTDQKSKAYAIDTLKKDRKDDRCMPHSNETIDELRGIVHSERGETGGARGYHDGSRHRPNWGEHGHAAGGDRRDALRMTAVTAGHFLLAASELTVPQNLYIRAEFHDLFSTI